MSKGKKNFFVIIIACLIVFLVLTLFFIYYKKNTIRLDLLKENNLINQKNIAILLEKKDGTGYEEITEFPTNGIYNPELSGCIDLHGNVLNGVLIYENGTVKVTTTDTTYCYIYFDLNPIPNPFTFYIGGSDNPEYITSINVSTYLSWADDDITHYCITNTENVDECNWKNSSGNSANGSHTLTSGDGTKTAYAYIKNNGGGISEVVSDTIILDSTPPTDNSIKINNGDAYTKSTSVTLTLSSSDAKKMCISNTTSCSSWEAYATSKNWTLTSGDGTKTVYVWYKDELGNTTSTYVSDTIIIDTSAPTNNSVRINGNAAYTASTSVTLTLSSTGVSTMCISNTTSCSNWEAYSTSKSWTLTSGDGTKTVYVWYKDAAGNKTSTYVSDSIILDTVYPTVTASAVSNNTTAPKISITSNETGTYCVNTSSTRTNFNSCVLTGNISSNTAVTTSALSSSDTYYVHVQDGAGNIGISSAVNIIIVIPVGEHLTNNKPTGLSSSSINGMYRFQGNSSNNYVKLGDVMYRIIGITSEANSTLGLEVGQIKVMKDTSIGKYYWHSTNTTNTIWTSSSMYSYLQGASVLGNTSVIPSGWSAKIDSVKWYIGDVDFMKKTSLTNITTAEETKITSSTSKIALMYASDYCIAGYLTTGTCTASYMPNSWVGRLGEWLMTRWGYYNDGELVMTNDYRAYTNTTAPNLYQASLNESYDVRPVFYLLPSVNFISGTGTYSDPFIVS